MPGGSATRTWRSLTVRFRAWAEIPRRLGWDRGVGFSSALSAGRPQAKMRGAARSFPTRPPGRRSQRVGARDGASGPRQ